MGEYSRDIKQSKHSDTINSQNTTNHSLGKNHHDWTCKQSETMYSRSGTVLKKKTYNVVKILFYMVEIHFQWAGQLGFMKT